MMKRLTTIAALFFLPSATWAETWTFSQDSTNVSNWTTDDLPFDDAVQSGHSMNWERVITNTGSINSGSNLFDLTFETDANYTIGHMFICKEGFDFGITLNGLQSFDFKANFNCSSSADANWTPIVAITDGGTTNYYRWNHTSNTWKGNNPLDFSLGQFDLSQLGNATNPGTAIWGKLKDTASNFGNTRTGSDNPNLQATRGTLQFGFIQWNSASGTKKISPARSFTNSIDSFEVTLTYDLAPPSKLWTGATDSSWDLGTTANWDLDGATVYQNDDDVRFDDSSGEGSVMLTGDIQPKSVWFSNTAEGLAYNLSGDPIAGSTNVLINAGGSVTFTSDNSYTGGTTIGPGSVTVGNGGSTGSLGSGPIAHEGSLTLNLDGSPNFANAITGGGSLSITGPGELTLSGISDFTGGTTITAGTVILAHPDALGRDLNFGGGFTLRDGTLDINGQSNYSNRNQAEGSPETWLTTGAVVLGGQAGATPQIVDNGEIPLGIAFANGTAITYDALNDPGTATIAARWTQSGTSGTGTRNVLVGDSSGTDIELDFTGGMGDINALDGRSSPIRKLGTGTMRISSENQFSRLRVSDGLLLVNHPDALGADRTALGGRTNQIEVDGSGILDLNGFSPSAGGLADNGQTTGVITNGIAETTSMLTLGSSGDATSFGGLIEDGNGTLALSIEGPGSLTLDSPQTYTGPTTVTGGTLLIGGSGSIVSSTSVLEGGSLGGNGNINAPVTLAGTLSPGLTVGTLTSSNTFEFQAGSAYTWELGSWQGGTPGSDFDQLVAATIQMSNTSNAGEQLTIAIIATPAADFQETPAVFPIASATTLSGFDPAAIIIDDSAFAADAGSFGSWAIQQTGNTLELVYTPGSASDFDIWAESYGLDPFTSGAPDSDPDRDGLDNEKEYAFGLSPVDGSSVSPILSGPEANGSFSYLRRNPDLTELNYSIWTSTDLSDWTEDTNATQSPGSIENEVQSVDVTPSVTSITGKLFIQVRAE